MISVIPDYPSFYASADGFVLPTHGEGWGRTPMEAMAMGLPTIASKWSGLTEFISPEYAIPLNITELERAFPHEPEKLGMPERSWRHVHQWARIDKYAVRGALRWVYNNQDQAKILGNVIISYLIVSLIWANSVFHNFSRDETDMPLALT